MVWAIVGLLALASEIAKYSQAIAPNKNGLSIKRFRVSTAFNWKCMKTDISDPVCLLGPS